MDVKKFLFSLVICTAFFSLATCNAAQVRLSNISAETFLQKMTIMLQTDTMKSACPIAITGLIRDEKSDLPNYGLTAWSALFAGDASSPPEGFVAYYVDSSGCVHSMKFVFKVNDNWADKYRNIMLSALWALDFTPEQAAQLVKGGKTENGVYTSDLHIAAHGKTYIIIMTNSNDMVTTLLLATDGGK